MSNEANERAARAAEERALKEYEEAARNPEGCPYFALVPERYYLGLWCVQLPEEICRFGAKSGDLVLLAQRKLDTQTDWMLKLRFRYHLGPTPHDPWSGDDRKSWSAYHINNRTEAEVLASMKRFLQVAAAGALILTRGMAELQEPDFLELRCTGDLCTEKMIAANKPWLHVRTEKTAEHLLKVEDKTKINKAGRG